MQEFKDDKDSPQEQKNQKVTILSHLAERWALVLVLVNPAGLCSAPRPLTHHQPSGWMRAPAAEGASPAAALPALFT